MKILLPFYDLYHKDFEDVRLIWRVDFNVIKVHSLELNMILAFEIAGKALALLWDFWTIFWDILMFKPSKVNFNTLSVSPSAQAERKNIQSWWISKHEEIVSMCQFYSILPRPSPHMDGQVSTGKNTKIKDRQINAFILF